MPATTSPDLQFAAVRIGTVRVGIAAGQVQQALSLAHLQAGPPRRQGALCGVVPHEGSLVPVVDLARWVKVGIGNSGTAPLLLVLRAGARRIGLRVDLVDGLADLPATALARLHHDHDPEEVFHSSATLAEDGAVLHLLDVARLAELAASWQQIDDAPSAGGEAAAAAGPQHAAGADAEKLQSGTDYALLQLTGVRLAVCASDIAEVLAMPALTYPAGTGGAYCVWRERHVPLLLAGSLPGLPDARTAPLLAMIEYGDLALGLPVESVLAMQTLPAIASATDGAADDAAAGAQDAPALTVPVYDAHGQAVHLLATAALFAQFPQAGLSQPEPRSAKREGAAAGAGGGTPNAQAYLVFEAGAQLATPIAGIEQIMPLPDVIDGNLGAGNGTIAWRGATLALRDLRPATPRQDGAAGGHLLVVVTGNTPVGYVVSRVELLLAPGSGRLYRMGAAGTGAIEFITVAQAEGESSYRIADLASLPATAS